jgi:rhodanese-related sulfurtransferase
MIPSSTFSSYYDTQSQIVKEVIMINECTVSELKEKLDTKANILLIDCRELDEWNQGHIEGAELMPLSHFDVTSLPKLTNKEQEIYIQCRSGARSLNLCQFLLSHGFKNLTNVRGGIMAWANAGYPIKA